MKVRKAVIPAAGLGTRMLPVTKTVPKEMLPMVDRPVMQYIVEEAVSAGIEDILIITNRGKDVMEDYFDYAPELEDKLRRAGKDDLIELVHKPANLANIFFVRQKQTLGLATPSIKPADSWATNLSPYCWAMISSVPKTL